MAEARRYTQLGLRGPLILAHLSDLHLGYHAYQRRNRGRNVRENDVALAFERTVQELTRLRPDVVVVAGDVFDRPNPPPSALVTLTRGLETLRSALPRTRFLLVAGVRDTPRGAGDPGVLHVLDTIPGVATATSSARSVFLEDLSLQVVLLPHALLLRGEGAAPDADPRARHRVLVAHARVTRNEGTAIDPGVWDYVALGNEHSHRRLGERVAYSGALERVGADPWTEAAEEKGFLTVELPERRSTFHPVTGRAVVALAPIRVAPDRDAMRRRVREVVGEIPGGIEDKIVLLRLKGIRRSELVLLEGDLLDALRQRALHLAVRVEPAESWTPPRDSDVSVRVREKLAASGSDTPDRVARLERLLGAGA